MQRTLNYSRLEESLFLTEGDYLFKTGLTRNLYHQFLESYQKASPARHSKPFVFVDEQGIRLVANIMEESGKGNEIVAITVIQDGFMEVLSLD